MSDTKWSKEEFLTYLMLYAAKTDGTIDHLETKDIASHHGEALTSKMLSELQKDSDTLSQEKIKTYVLHHNMHDQVDEIMYEIDRVFFVNGSYENDEVDRFNEIKSLLKTM